MSSFHPHLQHITVQAGGLTPRLAMPKVVWKYIDSLMDVANATGWDWEGHPDAAEQRGVTDLEAYRHMAGSIRQAGWDQIPEDVPFEQVVDVALARQQWQFIVEEYRHALPDIDDDDRNGVTQDVGVLCRGLIDLITTALNTPDPE